MPEITKVELYHKGIHEKYSMLYIKMFIDNADFLCDDVNITLKDYFDENKQPFEDNKTYELCIYCDYINISSTNRSNINDSFNHKAESIRYTLDFLNIDEIFIFGNKVIESPKIIIEIVEQYYAREKRNFILPDQNIYEDLMYFYKKYYLEECLKDNSLMPGKRNRLIKKINNEFPEPRLSYGETVKYLWAAQICRPFFHSEKLYIWDKKKNSFTSYSPEHEMWGVMIFPKIYDDEKSKRAKDSAQDYFDKRMGHFYMEFMANTHSFYIICDTLKIPFTTDEKIIQKAFIEQYEDLISFSDEEAEKVYKRLVYNTNKTIHKSNFILANGNFDINNAINEKKLSISEAYSKLISENSNNLIAQPCQKENSKKFNLNFIKYCDFQNIQSINPQIYKEIVKYRQNEPFESVDDLLKIPGINKKKFDKLKHYFEV